MPDHRHRRPTILTGTLQVEFVAADHQPFDPPVFTQAAFQTTRTP